MACRSFSSTLRGAQRPRKVSAADTDPSPTPVQPIRPCANLAPSCALRPLPHVFGKGPSSVHEGDTQARNHAGGHVIIQAFSVAARSPVAMSCCETSNSSSQERDVTFSLPPTQACANKNESRGTRMDGAPVDLHKGSGSHIHFCPRPCSSTCRWASLATHRHWGPLCVYTVLSCPIWPCYHRMCVIAKETGLSPLARTCSRTWIFLRRLHILALRSLCLNTIHVRKRRSKKIGDNFP